VSGQWPNLNFAVTWLDLRTFGECSPTFAFESDCETECTPGSTCAHKTAACCIEAICSLLHIFAGTNPQFPGKGVGGWDTTEKAR
jgi:hypothetical protein